MEKQKLLYQQARLHDRGAAEMVFQTISASKGRFLTEGPASCNTTMYYNTYTITLVVDEKSLRVLSFIHVGIS